MVFAARYHDSALDGVLPNLKRKDGSFLFVADSVEEAPKVAERYRQGRPGGYNLTILEIEQVKNGY